MNLLTSCTESIVHLSSLENQTPWTEDISLDLTVSILDTRTEEDAFERKLQQLRQLKQQFGNNGAVQHSRMSSSTKNCMQKKCSLDDLNFKRCFENLLGNRQR